MQFKNTTDKTGIIERCELLCSIGDGGISGDTTLLKQFTGLINEAYFEVWMAEMSVDGKARADDFNYTDYPDAPITLVVGQADCTIPVAVAGANVASFLRFKGIYYMSGNERIYLRPMVDGETQSDTNGTITAYKINGKSIFFERPVSTEFATNTPTVHVEFQRVPDAFLSTDTTQQPGFIETYHDLLPLRASAKYLLPIDGNLSTRLDQQFYTRLELFKRDVSRMDSSNESVFEAEHIRYR